MNTAGLLIANLERLLSSPTSAETIRKLIFDLAIRGQLTTQSDKDEPASVLIAKVIRTAQAEDRKFSAEPAVTERPFELPSGWEWVRLGNTGRIFNGTSASAGEKVRLSKTTEGLPFIATKDVGYGRDPLCYENGLKVPHGDKDYKVARSGAVLICAEGGSAGKKVGQTNRSICFGNKLYANETWAGIESGYILSVYQSNFFYGEFKAKMAGIIGGIARSDFRSLRIPLPPLAEQKRIVAKVDELMVLCDRLEAQLKERDVKQAALTKAALAKFTEDPTPENLQLLFHPSFTIEPDDLKKIVLDLAVRGKLERQDPKDEPVEELLARVRKDSQGQKHGEKLGLITANGDELPHSIPSSWAWSCVQEIAQPNESVTYGILKPVWVESGIPTVRVTEMRSGVIDVDALPKCEPERASKFSKTTLKEGDLLISKDGTIGKTAFVPRELAGGNITQHMLRFAISSRLDRFFVRICIDAPPCQAWMIGETKGVALQGVNVGDFRRMPIPIPPLEEQRRIVARVAQLLDLIRNLENQLEASRTTGEKLLEAMVAELTAD